MRRALALFWLLGLLPCLAAAQAYTTVTATGVTVDNGSGTAVNPPSGSQLCFLGVNNQGAAVTYTPSGGSPVSGTVCGTLDSSGALTASLQVANPATASPLGLLYTITVVHSSTTYLTIPMVSLSGSLFSYDAFALPGTATATGIGKAHLACSNGAQWTSTTLSPGNQRCNSSGLWDSYPPALYCPSGQAYVVPQQGGTAFCISPSLEGDGAPSGTCVEKSTYLDISSTDFYACKNAAWALIGSGSGSVVSSINGASGSFTFSGSGVSCTSTTCTFGGGSVTWPTSGKAVISNGTNTPNGVAEVDGDCLLGVSGAWATGSCAGGSVKVNGTTVTTPNFTLNTPAPRAGYTNVEFQYDSSGNVSAQFPSATEIHDPTNFVFGSQTTTAVTNLQPTSFITTADPLTSPSTFTTYSVGSAGAVTVTGGVATIAGTGATDTIIAQNVSSFSMPQAFVSTTVSQNGTDSSTADYAGVGIVKDASNFVVGEVDRVRNLALIHIRIGGTDTITSTSFTPPSAPYNIGFSLVGNNVSIYVDSGSGWVWKLTASTLSEYDFTTSGNMTGWHGGVEAGSGGTGTTWKFAAPLNIGYFGSVSAEDLRTVTTPNGSPYMNGTVAYFTGSCSDGKPGTNASTPPFGGLYQCVWSYDTASGTVAETGVIFFSRSGHVYNDIAGNVVYDEASGTYYVSADTWPSSTVTIALGTTTTNVLSGFHTVTASNLTLPGASGHQAFDGALAYQPATGTWLLAYVVLNGAEAPYLASSPDLSTWTLVADDTSHGAWEQTSVTLDNGALYFIYGGPLGTGTSSRVYDSTLTYIGALNATINGNSNTNPGGKLFGFGNTEYLISWNSTQWNANDFTWGEWQVSTAPRYIPNNVTSITAVAPLTANTFSGSAQKGAVSVACPSCSTGGSYPAAVTVTASTSSELDFTTCLSSSYKRYQISFTDLVLSSDNNEVRLQFSGDGGSTYDSTSAHYPYNHSYSQINSGSGGNGTASTGAGFSVSLGTSLYTSVNPFEASFIFQNPNSALPKSFFGAITAAFGGTTAIYNGNGGGIYSQTSTVNAFRVIPNSGTITSGTVTCQPLPQ